MAARLSFAKRLYKTQVISRGISVMMQQQDVSGGRDEAALSTATATGRVAHQRLVWTAPSVTTLDIAELTMGATGPVSDGITVES